MMSRCSPGSDELYTNEDGRLVTSAKGVAKKEAADANFTKNPLVKYRHVMSRMRQNVGIDQDLLRDAQLAKRYFQQFAPIGKIKWAQYMLQQMNAIHEAIIDLAKKLKLM